MGFRSGDRRLDDDGLVKPLLSVAGSFEPQEPKKCLDTITPDGSDSSTVLSISSRDETFDLIEIADYGREVCALAVVGFPIGMSSFLRVLMAITDISILGRLSGGTNYLAAAGLANVIMDVTSTFSSTAADSLNALCSQAIGADNPKLAGRWLKIGLVVAVLSCLPVMVSWNFVDAILLAFGAPSDISQLSRTFALWSTIGLIPNTVYYALRQYFQSMKLVYPALFNNMIFVFLNCALNVVFVHGFGSWNGLGFIGSPIATSVSRTLQLTAFVSYTCCYLRLHSATWPDTPFWSCFTKRNVVEYCHQTLPTIIGNASSQWLMQAITLLAAKIGVVEVATQSAIYGIFYAFQCLSLGLSKACTCRVGYLLGASRPRHAQQTARICIFLSFVLGLFIAALLVLLRTIMGGMFSRDHAVWRSTAELTPVLALSFIGLSCVMVLSAILYGQGRPKFVAITSACISWLVSLPLAYTLAFGFKCGLRGLWIGLTCGYCTISAITAILLCRSDWGRYAVEAARRSETIRSESCNHAA